MSTGMAASVQLGSIPRSGRAVGAQRGFAPVKQQPRVWRVNFNRVVVSAQATDAPAAATAPQTSDKSFMQEMRTYAMKLHTRDQSKEGAQESARTPFSMWIPQRTGFLRFLAESKVVYDEFEKIMQEAPVPYYKNFTGTGLERGAALQRDIEYMQKHFALSYTPSPNGPGHTYARFLRELSVNNPPAFICHYYNHYFAHTAGGRMIGAKVSQVALGNWVGDFYKWDGDVKELLNGARASIESAAAGWSREEKDACLAETPATFKWAGSLVKNITEF